MKFYVKDLATKSDIRPAADFAMPNKKIADDLNYLLGNSYFQLWWSQNHLIFHPLFDTLKICHTNCVEATSWKSVGISKE